VAPGPEGAILGLRIESSGASLREPDVFVENAANGSPARPEIAFSPSGREATIRAPIRHAAASALAGTELRVTVVDGSRSAEAIVTPELGSLSPAAPAQRLRLAMAGLALLGGLVLNLMPCVLPVLSLKLLALAGYAGAERRDARLGLLATAAGVLASFAVLAGAAIALKAAGAAVGWGIQFQQPWFLAGMALLTTLFAASLWDWLPIALPGAVAATAGSMRGGGRFAGAFLLGVFATLLAASCSAPFVGTALGFALARGPLDIALVFAGLGLGMAVPFLTAAAAPRLVDWLPRPGRWMGWLRHALGLALLATAAWLLSVLATEISPRVALFSAVLLAALLALLAWRQRQIAGRPMRSVTSAIAAVLAAVAVALPALHGEAPNAAPEPATGLWRPFDAVGLRRQLADGKLVFVDVSAAWCLTCKANELTVLDRSPVADYLRDAGVVAMRADWTRPDPAVTAYLQSFGRYGVPLDVVYGPGAPDGIALPELLTLGAVIDAMGRARAAREAAR
jgi:suppressor for copper-sensitivity B